MESQEQAFHPFHRPWKSRKPGVIPTFPQLRRLLIYIRVQKQNPDLRPKPRGWAKLNCRSGPNISCQTQRHHCAAACCEKATIATLKAPLKSIVISQPHFWPSECEQMGNLGEAEWDV